MLCLLFVDSIDAIEQHLRYYFTHTQHEIFHRGGAIQTQCYFYVALTRAPHSSAAHILISAN